MNKQQIEFVGYILQGETTNAAYHAAFGGTDNAASIRSLASRQLRNPDVQAAIKEGLAEQRAAAIECGTWTRAVSIAMRTNILAALQAEMERRQQGLNEELAGIEADSELTDAKKRQLKGRAMQRAVVGRDIVSAQISLCDTLDRLTTTTDSNIGFYEIPKTPRNEYDPERLARIKAEQESFNNAFGDWFPKL